MYEAKVIESSRELSPREKLAVSDTSDMVNLNDCDAGLLITPKSYVKVSVHNDHIDNPDYQVFIIEGEDAYYYTSSESFEVAFKRIWEAMQETPEEVYSIKLLKLPSKNYKDGKILSCKIV